MGHIAIRDLAISTINTHTISQGRGDAMSCHHLAAALQVAPVTITVTVTHHMQSYVLSARKFGHSKALERPCGGKFWQGFQTQQVENPPRLLLIFQHQNIPSRPMPVSVSSTLCIFTCTIITSSIQPVSYSRSAVPT